MIATDRARAIIAARLLASPVARHLGIAIEVVEPGRVSLRLPFAPTIVTVAAVVHGGVVTTLADVATAVAAADDVPTNGATASIAISFLAPADGCDLIATGRCLRVGTRQTVVRTEITNPAGSLIAEALVTVSLS